MSEDEKKDNKLDKTTAPQGPETDHHKSEKNYMTEGMVIGMCLGMAIGQLLFNNLATGLSVGMGLGLAMGTSIKRKD